MEKITENQSCCGTGASFLPTAIGLAGLCLGAIALYISLSSRGNTNAYETRLTEVEDRLKRTEAHTDENAEKVNAIDAQMHALLERLEADFQKINQSIAETNAHFVNHSKAPVAKTTINAVKPMEKAEAQAPANTAEGNAKNYTIQGGDTFAKIAQRYGLSAQALIDANPTVDPKRLKIGQQINLPRP